MENRQETVVIEAGHANRRYWRELWRYRELFLFLAWRDFLVRYKQAVFGVAWALLRPALALAVFTLLFGTIANLPSAGLPYALWVLAGLLPWQLFATSLSDAGMSLVNNAGLVSKVYFPRIVLPASNLLVNLVDLVINLGLMAALMVGYGVAPAPTAWLLPLFVGLALFACLGSGLLVAALSVKYRDVRYVLPFLVQVGQFVSPVGYSSTLVPEPWLWLYRLNPMAGAIDGVRWCLFGVASPGLGYALLSSVAVSLLLFLGGLWVFRATERSFADFI